MHPLTVYRASAGSGKTFTLAVQYIKLLLLSASGGEHAAILGVTFTNKATAEMKDRILQQLFGIGAGLPSSDDYLDALRKAMDGEPDAPATDDEIRRRCRVALHQILHDYSHFRVQTIDAFFQSVLRGLAHELGLTANLQVELSDRDVLSEAVDRIVDHLQDEPLVRTWMMDLVRERIENNERWDVRRMVKAFGSTIFNEDYQLRGDALRQLLADSERFTQVERDIRHDADTAIAAVKAYARDIDAVLSRDGVDYSDFSNGQRILATFMRNMRDGRVENVAPSDTLQRWAADSQLMVTKTNLLRRPELQNTAADVSALLQQLIDELPQLQWRYNSSRLALKHIRKLRLLERIDREVTQLNAETSRFNLAKTPILLNQMIGSSDVPFIFEKIGAQLHHIMIDEFQDTSRLQWDNFRPLLAETRSRGGRNLVVGDVKQSIYRFRGGDWRTLANIQRDVVPTPVEKPLDINFRSEKRIVDFVAEFFLTAVPIMDEISAAEEAAVGADFSFDLAYKGKPQVASPKRQKRAPEGYIRCVLYEKGTDDTQQEILDDLRQQIRELAARGQAYSDMTILVRNNDEATLIVADMSADPTMPRIVSDEAFLLGSSAAVCLIIEALRSLADPTNLVAQTYLSEHLAGQSAALEKFELSRELLLRMPMEAMVEWLIRCFRLDEADGQEGYLFCLMDVVADFARRTSSDLNAFITFWDEKLYKQSVPAGEVTDGIRIMTIHKAKGLEFQTVFLPFATWTLDKDRYDDLLWTRPTQEPYSAFSLLPITPSSRTAPVSVFARDYAEAHLSQRLDEFNALYVALTRPRANLYIWSYGSELGPKRFTVGGLMAATLPACGSLQSEEIGSNEAPATLYTWGEPCLKTHKDDDATRVTPKYLPRRVAMQTFDANLPFRQSNRSAAFFDEMVQADVAELKAGTSTALALGRLIHTVLQSVATLEDLPRVLDNFTHEGIISQTAADDTYVSIARADLERSIQRALSHPMVADWFGGEWQLYNECAILTRDDKGRAITLRPDRVMIASDASRIVVVDFKTANDNEDYTGQVQRYMHRLRQMYPQAAIEGYLWFILTGRTRRVPEK